MRVSFVIIGLLFSNQMYSQNADEWTRQKKTQIKYLLQQIAANKVYIDYIEKGYGIARDGLNVIQNIKKGDFDLHHDFIGSLSKVNPRIAAYSRVADIIAYQVRIVKNINLTIKNLKDSDQFTPDELDYTKKMFDNFLKECLKNINDLFLIITSDEFSMKDDERISRIDQLYSEMQNKYSFCKIFIEECAVLAMQRLSEQVETNIGRKLNELK